jgi:hypothetical protein
VDKKSVVIEMNGNEARDGVTGEPVTPKQMIQIPREEWDRFIEEVAKDLESEGKFALAAKLRGKQYNPTFGERVKHTAVRMKSATVTVLLAAVTPVALILLWEGIRFIIPSARQLPGFIKYEQEKLVSGKVVRLSAGSR